MLKEKQNERDCSFSMKTSNIEDIPFLFCRQYRNGKCLLSNFLIFSALLVLSQKRVPKWEMDRAQDFKQNGQKPRRSRKGKEEDEIEGLSVVVFSPVRGCHSKNRFDPCSGCSLLPFAHSLCNIKTTSELCASEWLCFKLWISLLNQVTQLSQPTFAEIYVVNC